MANPLRTLVDRFLGRGEAAVTVPPLDGALKPNNLLEEARIGLGIPAPDNLVSTGEVLIFSSGNKLLRQPFDGSAGAAFGIWIRRSRYRGGCGRGRCARLGLRRTRVKRERARQ